MFDKLDDILIHYEELMLEFFPKIRMMTKISFWKSVPVREETRLPCLRLNCTACTSIILRASTGKWS